MARRRPSIDDRGSPPPLSAFGRYVSELCHDKCVSLASIADRVGGKARLSYAMRGHLGVAGRRALLTAGELNDLAHAVRASRSETRRLVLLGLLEHAPKELRSCVIQLLDDVVTYAQRLADDTQSASDTVVPRLDFSGRERELPPL